MQIRQHVDPRISKVVRDSDSQILKRVLYYNPSINTNFRLLQRHNMTKMRNKIPANISDFTV
jgi:hypothetical protein